jgi:hypothetical protein
MALTFRDPIRPRLSAMLRYVQNFSLGTSATAHTYGSSLDFKLNSLFNPTSSGGHQPFYFDQMALFYNRYRVNRVRVVVVAVPLTDGTTYEFSGILTSPAVSSTIAGATTDVVLEKPMVQSVKLQTAGSMGSGRLVWDIQLHVAVGTTAKEYSSNTSDYSALFSASPARVPLLQLAAANISAAAAQNVRCTAEVTYYAEFFERLVPSQS